MKNKPLFSRKLLKGAFKKFMRPSLLAIEEFTQQRAFKITLAYHDTDEKTRKVYDADIVLNKQKNGKGIDFEISIKEQLQNGGVKHINSYGLENALHIHDDHVSMLAQAGAIRNFECSFPALPRLLTGYLTNLRTQQKPYGNAYFRLMIPVDNDKIIFPTTIIATDLHLLFDVKQWDMQPSLIGIRFPSLMGMCVQLTVNGKAFHFYAIEDIKWVFIDSLERMSYDEFQQSCANIRLAYGLLTARYYAGDVFTVISKDKDFKKIADIAYNLEEESKSGKQQLINPTELFHFYGNVGSDMFKEKMGEFHERFNAEIFSHFCDLLGQNPVLRRATEILVSSVGLKDPLQQGIMGSVALETITELVAEEQADSVRPVSDKQYGKKLIKRLKAIISAEFEEITEDGRRIIDAKLSDLNKPTNKGKLLFPFHFFNIELRKAEEEVLNSRNEYLHGRSPFDHTETWKLEQIGLYLHYLTGILILKYIGYKGHVMHLPSWDIFHDQTKMLEFFPFTQDQIKGVAEKVMNGIDLDDSDLKVFEDAGQLSAFIEQMIRLV